MIRINVQNFGTIEAREGTRLVCALEDNGVDLLHKCGGYAKCTTCRVEFSAGEPSRMTEAELKKLEEKDLLGEVRLSCQIECRADMSLMPIYLLSESDLDDPGPLPEEHITPDPVWLEAPHRAPALASAAETERGSFPAAH